MITLTALETDFNNNATRTTAKRLWRTWTTDHPALAPYDNAAEAVAAIHTRRIEPAPIVNAFLALSVDHVLARQAILNTYIPWIGRHLATHTVPSRERGDQLSVLITAFLEAAVTLAPTAPHTWPTTTIVHVAETPIRTYYRRLNRIAEPLGGSEELDRCGAPVITATSNSTCRLSGPELVIAALSTGVADKTISLDDANLVARMVNLGETATEQAPRLHLAPRTAQWRVQRTALRLADHAA
jgi:hypothetical protein